MPASRPPVERMLRIHEELRCGALTNCTKLGALLEVSVRTVQRDLDFMRDRLNLPVEYVPQLYSYRYSHPVENFPTTQVTEGEMLSLLVAQKALEQYEGTPFHRHLVAAFEKIRQGLREQITVKGLDQLEAVTFRHFGHGKVDAIVFGKLCRAILGKREITFLYKKHGKSQNEYRKLQPYHLANLDNQWYLIGYDLDRSAMRTFALPRMDRVEISRRTFVRTSSFSPGKFLAHSIGPSIGQDVVKRVRVRFDAFAAGHIRERVWHPSMKLIEMPTGGVEATLDLGRLDDIQRWILNWGSHAEVLEPLELVEAIKSEVNEMAKHYALI